MSAIARYFNKLHIEVSGYDKTPSPITEALGKEGIRVFFDDNESQVLKDADLVVYTPAIPKDSVLLNFYMNQGYEVVKRSKVLGIISHGAFTIAVSGSHGKTTVSSMIAHILKDSGKDCSAFLGGIAKNYNSNYIQGNNNIVVVEADEYDRSFHQLSPDMIVITAVDTDHLDIYGTKEKIEEAFIEFTQKMKPNGLVISQKKVSINDQIKGRKIYYSADEPCDLYVTSLVYENGISFFTTNKTKETFELHVGGKHNVENAVSAIGIALELGIEETKIKSALKSFNGIKRRFEKIIEQDNLIYIDDYAHHPEEIRALLNSIKGLYPGKKISILFQPHLFSRTKDLAIEFGEALSMADKIYLLDIYPARELPMEGVTSKLILDNINNDKEKQIIAKEDIIKELGKTKTEVFLTVGAGDIDRLIEPIKNQLLNNEN